MIRNTADNEQIIIICSTYANMDAYIAREDSTIEDCSNKFDSYVGATSTVPVVANTIMRIFSHYDWSFLAVNNEHYIVRFTTPRKVVEYTIGTFSGNAAAAEEQKFSKGRFVNI